MSKRNILYVDDEFDNILVFEAAFEDDFNVLTANSGEEALDILEEHHVPVVVSDQRMPGMTGVELFEIIGRRFADTKRILLTGYTDPDAMADAINKGKVFHFVKKPWQRGFLHSLLVRALEAYDLEKANNALTHKLIMSEHCALLGRATAQIAHEIHNQLCLPPLLDLIESRYSHDKDLVAVGRFTQQTYQKLEKLIEEVSNFMRFEQDAYVMHPVALSTVFYELAPFIRYDKTIPDECMTTSIVADSVVNANKVNLQQVLVNLIRNAVHAIRDRADGRITLKVDRDGEEAVITVADNGHGITPEILQKIWEPFFTTKGEEGNGIGLDVSRRLVESFGGTIRCESTPGAGTTFTIRLPRSQSPATDAVLAEEGTIAGLTMSH